MPYQSFSHLSLGLFLQLGGELLTFIVTVSRTEDAEMGGEHKQRPRFLSRLLLGDCTVCLLTQLPTTRSSSDLP